MTRSRMMRSAGEGGPVPPTRGHEDDEEAPSPRTTIVGGRPPEQEAKLPPVPTGIQQLLRLASVDDGFCRQLVARRGELARAAGVELTPSETAILAAIPAAQLIETARGMPQPPAPRRDFLRQSAATAVVLLGGAALSQTPGCECNEKPPPRPTEPAPPTGIAPDLPPERPEVNAPQPAGIMPDLPPERPAHREMETEGGAAPDEPEPDEEEPAKPDAPLFEEPPERPRRTDTRTKGGADPDLAPKKKRGGK